jgi:tetratricopeptide (TPR) repeat protein
MGRALLVLLLCGAARGAEPIDAKAKQLSQYLEAISGLYESLEYERALAIVIRARDASQSTADDSLLLLWEGILQRELNQEQESEDAFRAALLLDRNAHLPTRVGPKVQATFDAVQSHLPPPSADGPPIAGVSLAVRSRPAPLFLMPLIGGTLALAIGSYFSINAYADFAALSTAPHLDLSTARADRDQGKSYQVIGAVSIGVGVLTEALALWMWRARGRQSVEPVAGVDAHGWLVGVRWEAP